MKVNVSSMLTKLQTQSDDASYQDFITSSQVVNNHSVLTSNSFTYPDADEIQAQPPLYISNINRHNETLFGICSTQQTCLSSENNKECSAQNPLIENIANDLLNKMINLGDETPLEPVMKKNQVSQSVFRRLFFHNTSFSCL